MTIEGLEPVRPEEERRLRLALRMIGEEAGWAHPAPSTAAVRPVPSSGAARSRHRRVVARAAVAAVALALGFLAVATADNGSGATGSSDVADGSARGLRDHEWIACSTTIVEGQVLDVRPAAEPGRDLVTIEVAEWIKPSEGPSEVELPLVDLRLAQVQEPLREGEHVLLAVSVLSDEEPVVLRGDRLARERVIIKEALPRAARTECPDFWLNQDDRPAL
ncbi:hypothetical protein [Streptomyces marincola]|uniref:hypothetical protein n=1 Tax=Streptomyces marincola TaxID=2878388 RepID=UPI001CF0E354|nr:hypothetical protein [Streptomyces marincola]UCM89729.1 hypothetical protein LC193_18195 [Streptomyces marincola]